MLIYYSACVTTLFPPHKFDCPTERSGCMFEKNTCAEIVSKHKGVSEHNNHINVVVYINILIYFNFFCYFFKFSNKYSYWTLYADWKQQLTPD